MKFLRLALAALLPLLASGSLHAQAGAQHNAQVIWKWRDAQGHVVASDRAPPGDVPESRILQSPGGPKAVAAAGTVDPSAATPATNAPAVLPASAPGTDPQLEARRKKDKEEAAAKAQATQEAAKRQEAARKADNCRRARSNLAALESGERIVRMNEKGEREVLEDAARKAEQDRTRKIMAADCS